MYLFVLVYTSMFWYMMTMFLHDLVQDIILVFTSMYPYRPVLMSMLVNGFNLSASVQTAALRTLLPMNQYATCSQFSSAQGQAGGKGCFTGL
jgi:hypothetical protein